MVLTTWQRLSLPQRFALLVVTLVLVLTAALSAKPLYVSARTWRADSLCQTALALQAEGRLSDALAKAHAAYQLAPTSPSVARTLAQLYEGVHPGRARDLWNAILADPHPAETDRFRAAQFFLQSGLLEDAERALGPLLVAPPFAPELCEAAAKLALAREDWARAEHWAKQGLSAKPDQATRLRLVQLLTEAGWAQGGTAREQAFADAVAATQQDGPEAKDTLAWLAARPELSPSQAKELLEALNRLGQEKSLAAADARLRQAPDQAPAVFQEVVAAHREADPETIAEAGRWLNQRGGASAVSQLIPESVAMSRRDLFLIRADAMALEGRWDDLEKLLQDPSIPVERVFVHAFQFRVALAQRKEKQADIFWERALQETNRQPALLWYLASYAEKLGRLDQAEAAYRRLAQDAGAARLAFLAWARMLEAAGETQRLRRLMIEIAARFPNEPAPRNDLLYLDLLTGQPPESRLADARSLVESDPTIGAYRVTLALALLKLGRASEALPLFDGFPPPDRWPPGWRAVHVAVLAANGQKDRAYELSAMIPRHRLKPEERSLLPR